MTEPDIFDTLRRLRYDLTAAQAKVTQALNQLADLNIPDPNPKPCCPRCGVPIKHTLEEHLTNVHGIPPPRDPGKPSRSG